MILECKYMCLNVWTILSAAHWIWKDWIICTNNWFPVHRCILMFVISWPDMTLNIELSIDLCTKHFSDMKKALLPACTSHLPPCPWKSLKLRVNSQLYNLVGYVFVSVTLIGHLCLCTHNLDHWLVICPWIWLVVPVYSFSMRTIPFTVPSTGSRPRPGDQRLVEEGSTSVTSGSEPSTPSTAPTTRGSMDSLSSAAGDNSFRGKKHYYFHYFT